MTILVPSALDRTLVVVDSPKGGVGKTLFSFLLASVFARQTSSLALLDADAKNGTLTKFLGKRDANGDIVIGQTPADGGVLSFNIDRRGDGSEAILRALEDYDSDLFLLDLPGGAEAEISSSMPSMEVFVRGLNDCNVRVVVCSLIEPRQESTISGALDIADMYSDADGLPLVNHVAVANWVADGVNSGMDRGKGMAPWFTREPIPDSRNPTVPKKDAQGILFNRVSTPARERFLGPEIGGIEIDLPYFREKDLEAFEIVRGNAFQALERNPRVEAAVRMRLNFALSQFEKQILAHRDVFGLPSE